MKPFRTAIIFGVVSAAIAWGFAYALLHEPNPRTMPDGSFLWVTDNGGDEDLTALLWAAGAYVLTFTPTLLFMRGRIRKNVFEKKQSIG